VSVSNIDREWRRFRATMFPITGAAQMASRIDLDTLYFRLSLIWLAALMCGLAYLFFA
jgi:hypothetical protein